MNQNDPIRRVSVVSTGQQLWVRPSADVLHAGAASVASCGPVVPESADLHDHEDFSTLWGMKVFAIMKLPLLGADSGP